MFEKLCSERTIMNAWKHVKSKGSAGGIDGLSLSTFETDLGNNILEVTDDLKTGKWSPLPYLKVEIPKKVKEKRKLGLLTIKDKVVQQAIRSLIEPRMEKMFFGNSYGYRPNKGALKAIRRALQERRNKKTQWILRLDIDNYFDNIDHEILQKRVQAVISDPEIVRLIMLCVKMGVVTKNGKWEDSTKGIPQGAVISPLLANLYLHSFDQFILSWNLPYVRYADDFIILCHTKEEAESLCTDATDYLRSKLKLSLNIPHISNVSEGFEFLGILIDSDKHSITEKKKNDLISKIQSINMVPNGFDNPSRKKWDGIRAYYGELLSENELKELDDKLIERLKSIIANNHKSFHNRNILSNSLCTIDFLCADYQMRKKEVRQNLTDIYLETKKCDIRNEGELQNKSIIAKRKREYKKKEIENSELIVTTPGTLIGLNSYGITVKKQGLTLFKSPSAKIRHITIMADGILLSSNLINHAVKNKIPIDIFSSSGEHIGFFLNANSMQCALWEKQANSTTEARNLLAGEIIEGKLTNQLNLVKYFNKYHKTRGEEYLIRESELSDVIIRLKTFIKKKSYSDENFIKDLMGFESQAAVRYWGYIRLLLADDGIAFEERIGHKATDLVNCMLNYGYSILYTKVCQALLSAQLNPYDSVIHDDKAENRPFRLISSNCSERKLLTGSSYPFFRKERKQKFRTADLQKRRKDFLSRISQKECTNTNCIAVNRLCLRISSTNRPGRSAIIFPRARHTNHIKQNGNESK